MSSTTTEGKRSCNLHFLLLPPIPNRRRLCLRWTPPPARRSRTTAARSTPCSPAPPVVPILQPRPPRTRRRQVWPPRARSRRQLNVVEQAIRPWRKGHWARGVLVAFSVPWGPWSFRRPSGSLAGRRDPALCRFPTRRASRVRTLHPWMGDPKRAVLIRDAVSCKRGTCSRSFSRCCKVGPPRRRMSQHQTRNLHRKSARAGHRVVQPAVSRKVALAQARRVRPVRSSQAVLDEPRRYPFFRLALPVVLARSVRRSATAVRFRGRHFRS